MTLDPVLVLITYRAQPGKADTAVAALSALIKTVVAEEPACGGIQMYQDAADPDRILLYEEWTSREAYLGPHMQTPHIRAFIAEASAFIAAPPEITFWRLRADAWPD